MRTLELNKSVWYLVNCLSSIDVTDLDGNYTGDRVRTYSDPVEIQMNILPRNGDIIEQVFGKDESIDMIGVSNDIVLNKDSLLFSVLPTDNEFTTYDYRVDSISKTLNTYVYGLKGRVK